MSTCRASCADRLGRNPKLHGRQSASKIGLGNECGDTPQMQIVEDVANDDLHGDWPGASVFRHRGDKVFHTYSARPGP